MLCLGVALWLYGYFAPHVSSLTDWSRFLTLVWEHPSLDGQLFATGLDGRLFAEPSPSRDPARVGWRRAFPLAVAVKVLIFGHETHCRSNWTSHKRL
jgi:hypothetical protein